ncbi:protein kinase domain-containing protein [Ditylenchus destructor]|uniref:Protein kinase domain-containing protein n=1 Tax=Ditylenchus destructor TaxID=166010 RepID=A0AAD4R370_9BILA|nr:protein kinase domain-containing protein [Ditylenchus destructor]
MIFRSILIAEIFISCLLCIGAHYVKLNGDQIKAFNDCKAKRSPADWKSEHKYFRIYKQAENINGTHYAELALVLREVGTETGGVKFRGPYVDKRVKYDHTDAVIIRGKTNSLVQRKIEKKTDELFDPLKNEINLLRCLPHHPFIERPEDLYVSTEVVKKSENGGELTAKVYHMIFDYHSTYVHGLITTGTLFDLIKKAGTKITDSTDKPSFRDHLDVVRFYMEICVLAIYHLHTLDMMHRDLRPSTFNVLRNGYLRLKDFAYAQTADSADNNKCDFAIAGYRAPEMYDAKKESQQYTKKVDIWGLGTTFLTILTGENYFITAKDIKDTIGEAKCFSKLSAKERRDVFSKSINKGLPFHDAMDGEKKELHDLLQNMLMVDPEHRFDIEAVLKHPYFTKARWDLIYREGIGAPVLPKLDEEKKKQQKYELTYEKRFLTEKSWDSPTEPQNHHSIHDFKPYSEESSYGISCEGTDEISEEFYFSDEYSLEVTLDTKDHTRRKIFHILNDGHFNKKSGLPVHKPVPYRGLPYGVPEVLTWTVLTNEQGTWSGEVKNAMLTFMNFLKNIASPHKVIKWGEKTVHDRLQDANVEVWVDTMHIKHEIEASTSNKQAIFEAGTKLEGGMKLVEKALEFGIGLIIKKLNKDKKYQLRWGVAYSQYKRKTTSKKRGNSMEGVVFRFMIQAIDPRNNNEIH